MLKPKEIAEVSLELWYLPLDKLIQVRELVTKLRKESGYTEPTDDSDEWTEEDEEDLRRDWWERLEREDPWPEDGTISGGADAQAG